jgi:hypothetical protein
MCADSSQPTPIAQWNPTTCLWETEALTLFSERQEPFSETWPTSGMTRCGRLFPLPASGHPIGGNESSSLELLHTPDTMPDAPNKGSNTKSKPAGLGNQVIELAVMNLGNMRTINSPSLGAIITDLNPILLTPRATDGTKGGPNQRGSSGDLMLPSAVMNLE